MPTESWSKYKYLFVRDFDRDERDIIFGFYEQCNTYDETVKAAYEISANPKQLIELSSDHDYRYHTKLIEKVNEILESFIKKYE